MTQQYRRAKLERIQGRGQNPYPSRFPRTHTAVEAAAFYGEQRASAEDAEIALAGRIAAMREMGKVSFLDLQDGSGRIQLFFRQGALGQQTYAELKDFDLGDFMGVKGKLFTTRTGELTLEVHEFAMLAKALQPPPEKWHGLRDVETRHRQRYLDLMANEEARQVFAARSRIISAMRRYLDEGGFLEVETPILWGTAGGAMARRFRTHFNALNQDLFLRIATELHLKRLLVGGYERVYEIGRIFRNEGVSTKHNPEFTSMEVYQAYADYSDMMRLTEDMVATIAQEVLGTTDIIYQGETISLSPPWRRVTLRDAILEETGIDFEAHPDAASLLEAMDDRGIVPPPGPAYRGRYIDHLLSTFVEPTLIQPTFLLDYPVELTPLAKRVPGSESLAERFEGFIGGLEVANAFTELNDPDEQRKRFSLPGVSTRTGSEASEDLDMMDEDFLVALEHGMPPAGGMGMGIDRLVMVLTDQSSIREVILFPQLRSRE